VATQYGFGLIDAGAAVNMAFSYSLLPPNRNASVSVYIAQPDMDIPDDNTKNIQTSVRVDEDFIVEHVELVLRAVHGRRGDLRVELLSPSGTVSVLFVPHTDTQENIHNWRFMTMRCWDESSRGQWTVRISDQVPGFRGQLNAWQLVIHGRDRAR